MNGSEFLEVISDDLEMIETVAALLTKSVDLTNREVNAAGAFIHSAVCGLNHKINNRLNVM